MISNQEKVLFSEAEIAHRVAELSDEIASAPSRPEIAMPILAGAFVFSADLLRALSDKHLSLPVEFIWLRAYGTSETPMTVKVLAGPSEAVKGKKILVIDGVLDSGSTLTKARDLLFAIGARSVTAAVAVAKRHPHRKVEADHVGFEAGPEFLYGYGMDHGGLGRSLPDIRVALEKD